jgi:DNA-binding response OmpR family regulator
MKLLVIDDDVRFTRSLYYLFYKSYTIHIASLAQTALTKLQENSYDLILLDLDLPDTPGQKLYHTIRAKTADTPVIIVSGAADPRTKVDMLGLGICDYITKPIYADELRARVAMHVRRPRHTGSINRLITHDLVVEFTSRTAFRNGRPIFLRAKEYALLESLALNAGQLVPKSLLADFVWESDSTEITNNLHVQMSHLRHKIDQAGSRPLIQTVHGQGYKLLRLPPLNLHTGELA